MALWSQAPAQLLDSTALANSFAALDCAFTSIYGYGITQGLTVGMDGVLDAGSALVGHLVRVSAPVALNMSGSGVFDVYVCCPAFAIGGNGQATPGTYPASDGHDTAVVQLVATGTTPSLPGALVATITLSSGTVTAVNNQPAGRVTIPQAPPVGTQTAYLDTANISGPGAPGVYTLSHTPSPVLSVTLFLNGVFVPKSAYSVSGATVTFASPPAEGSSLAAQFTY